MRKAGFAIQLLSPHIVIPLIIGCFASTLAFGSVGSTYSLDADCSIFFDPM
jgi:hypothetical protein